MVKNFTSGNAYLFTWNPQKSKWPTFDADIEEIEKNGWLNGQWSCGNTKKIRIGDRIFLMKVGNDPRGLIGSGYANSFVFQDEHWNGLSSDMINFVRVKFDYLIDPRKEQILELSKIKEAIGDSDQNWTPQNSGIRIKHEIINPLESCWFEFLRNKNLLINSRLLSEGPSDSREVFFEGQGREMTVTRYERNPIARQKCLDRYGYSCIVCKFNFEETFGELGRGYIQVHHINPISEIAGPYEIEPEKDLVPVCPNCHAMLHARHPVLSVEELKAMMR